MPIYPASLREAGVSGRVMLTLIVDTTGHAEAASIRVLDATNNLFIEPAIASSQSCRFTPALRNGLPVRVRVSLPISFRAG
jgi:TonB family protein